MSDFPSPSRPTDLPTAALKVPPHSLEAEQAVLGGLMLNNAAWDRIADQVSDEDFYRRQHQLIFAAVAALAESGQPFDVVTLSERLSSRGELSQAGDMSYLSELAQNTPSAANIVAYANIVRERALLRGLIDVGGRIADSAFRPEGREAKVLLEQAESDVFAIAERGNRSRTGFVPIGRVLEDVMIRVEELYENQNPITGITTGFNKLDEMTSGLQRSDLIIVAGRPSMGKCVVAGTRLVDPDSGRRVTIDEMVASRNGDVLTLDGAHRIKRSTPSAFVDDGFKPVFRVRTRSGREIETTLTHPFLTPDGWRPLEKLSAGDAIGIPRRLPVFGRRVMPDAEVERLAYATGGVSLADTLPVSKGFSQAMNALASAASLGVTRSAIAYWRPGYAVPVGGELDVPWDTRGVPYMGPARQHRASANQSCRSGRASDDLMGVDVCDKRVPGVVFELPESSLALFLNRLFACDGNAYVQDGTQAVVDYATLSEELAHDVCHLLLRFGVLARLRRRNVTWEGEARTLFSSAHCGSTEPGSLRGTHWHPRQGRRDSSRARIYVRVSVVEAAAQR